MRGTWLCDACEREVPRLERGICFRCGFPAAAVCRSCAQLSRAINQARAAYPYTGWVTQAIRGFKYGNEYARAEDLAVRMEPALALLGPVDAIVPVPLHGEKLRLRGYNQSLLLAEAISQHTGIPVKPALTRSRATASQVKLGRDERQANVTGAFTLDPAWVLAAGARVVLLDDVRTTSSTLNACADAMLRTAPAGIDALTLALDIPRRELATWLQEQRGR